MSHSKFQVGDLVRFSNAHILGVVTDTKISSAFDDNILDVKVLWLEPMGEEFWCLEIVLEVISRINN